MENENYDYKSKIETLEKKVLKLENYVKVKKIMTIISVILTVIAGIAAIILGFIYINNFMNILNS